MYFVFKRENKCEWIEFHYTCGYVWLLKDFVLTSLWAAHRIGDSWCFQQGLAADIVCLVLTRARCWCSCLCVLQNVCTLPGWWWRHRRSQTRWFLLLTKANSHWGEKMIPANEAACHWQQPIIWVIKIVTSVNVEKIKQPHFWSGWSL